MSGFGKKLRRRAELQARGRNVVMQLPSMMSPGGFDRRAAIEKLRDFPMDDDQMRAVALSLVLLADDTGLCEQNDEVVLAFTKMLLSKRPEMYDAAHAALDAVERGDKPVPVPMVLRCPKCGKQHLDVDEWATRPHRTHLCDNTPAGPGTGCGHLWRPVIFPTVGVRAVEPD
jgi:hypothetical protein